MPDDSSEISFRPYGADVGDDRAGTPPAPRGKPLLAWIVIVIAVGVIIAPQFREERAAGPEGRMHIILLELQAKYIVGAANWLRGFAPGQGDDLGDQMQHLNSGTVAQRQRYAVLAGELQGPAEAELVLDRMEREAREQQVKLSANETRVQTLLKQLHKRYQAGDWKAGQTLPPEDAAFLDRELDWFGQLARYPQGTPDVAGRQAVLRPAFRVVGILLGGMFCALLVGLAGLVGLILLAVLCMGGNLRGGLTPGPHGGVYAETFAIWLLLFFAANLAVHWLAPGAGISLWSTGLIQLFSLLAIFWPVARGVPWRQVRQEIGLTFGRRPLLEPFMGIVGYAMSLPMLALGVLGVLILMTLQALVQGPDAGGNSFTPVSLPSHPVVEMMAHGDRWVWLQLLIVASVLAPVVEEIMFRGVLYRHLRDTTGRWGGPLSALASATLTGFVFAVIHPQGLIATPALMAIAFGLSLLREWRETLIPSMVAHGINNGVVLGVLTLALG